MAENYTNVDRINDEMASTLLPVIVIVIVYLTIGIVGNPLVVYYYGCHVKPSPSGHFIVAMAAYDITICCISMPLEIVDMEFPFKFPSKAACKILRFVNYFASISSGLTLVAIATDRYRKVCQPFKTQITTKMTKIIIAITCLFSFSVSWPAFVFYDLVEINITSVSYVIGYDCTTVRNREFKFYITIYNGVCFLIFLGSISSLTVLYIVIGRKLCLLKKFRVAATKGKSESLLYTPQTSSSDLGSHSKQITTTTSALQQISVHIPLQTISDIEAIDNASSTDNEKLQTKQVQSVDTKDKTNRGKLLTEDELSSEIHQGRRSELQAKEKRQEMSDGSASDASANNYKLKTKSRINFRKVYMLERQNKIKDQYIHLKKYTILMLSITTAFVLSFLPYLCLVTWRTLVPQYEGNILSTSGLVAYNIFLRSWMISSVVNPVIYGFFNTDFRMFVYALLRRCIWWIKVENEITWKNSNHESSHTHNK